MTDSFWAATRSDTAVLMLAASDGPDLDDVLTVLVRHEPDYALVTVAGEVDFASAAGLRERLFTLAKAGRPEIVRARTTAHRRPHRGRLEPRDGSRARGRPCR